MRLSRRALELHRLSGIGRALAGDAARADGRRFGGGGLRTRRVEGADAGAAAQVSRRPQDSAPAVHQQDGQRLAPHP